MRLKNFYRILLAIFFLFALQCKKESIVEGSFFMADTIFTVKIYNSLNEGTIKELEIYLAPYANNIDRYNKASIIHKLNERGDYECPQWLIDLIEYSQMINKKTDSGFDITIGELIDIWGFGIGTPHLPAAGEIKNFLAKKRMLSIDGNRVNIENCKIDLGGLGKGFLLEKARQFLGKKGIKTYLLNFGGNIFCNGERQFKIGIQDPFSPNGQYKKVITIKNKAVSTSGDYERYFEKNGKRYCHIFDPKTGYPQCLYHSVTVISDSPMDSDVLSTAIFVRGKIMGSKIIGSGFDILIF